MARRAPRKRYSRKASVEPKGMSQRNKMKVAFAVLVAVAVAVLVAIFATPQGGTNGTTAPSTPGPANPSIAPGPTPPGPPPPPPGTLPPPPEFEWWYSRDVMYGTIYPIVIGVSFLLFMVFGFFNRFLYQNKGSEMTLKAVLFVCVLTGLTGLLLETLTDKWFPYDRAPNPNNVDYETHLNAGGYYLAGDICVLVAIVCAELLFIMIGFMLYRGKGGKSRTAPKSQDDDSGTDKVGSGSDQSADEYEDEAESKGSEPTESQAAPN